MTGKHTPGPWRIDRENVEHTCCWNIAIRAKVPTWHNAHGFWDEMIVAECDDADAHLIAAAPALLEALEVALSSTHELDDLSEWRSDARAAIAKARGQE